MKFKNPYKLNLYRDGKLIDTRLGFNGVTTEGVNHALNVLFNAATQIAANAWDMRLINNSPTPTVDVTDTVASHAGWVEFTDYTGGDGVEWNPGTASGGELVNAATIDFPITGSGSVYGFYVQSTDDTVLFATAPFEEALSVINGDTLKITYTVGLE